MDYKHVSLEWKADEEGTIEGYGSVFDVVDQGGDIVARGIAVGPEVARILKAVEPEWVAEDFPDAARVAQLVDQKIGRTSD